MSKQSTKQDYIKKVFITSGKNSSLKVPFKEITQTGNPIDNPPLKIYDTSGPLGDDNFKATLKGIAKLDRKSTRLNSSHVRTSRMPSSA